MLNPSHNTFRDVLASEKLVRVVGAHTALGAALVHEAGFQAVWASSFEVSAARCLPDASVLTMSDYLESAAHMQKAVPIPVIADCDTGYGNNLNVAHMVHEYEAAGITAVCIEDKIFPKMNSFADDEHTLVETKVFANRLAVAKSAQQADDFFVIARTEALISGRGVDEALERCYAYADAGADAVLIHSKARTEVDVVAFLAEWDKRRPVVIVPTTYPGWHTAAAAKHGVSVIVYANQGLRATVHMLRKTFRRIYTEGDSASIEDTITPISEIFALQRLDEWQALER